MRWGLFQPVPGAGRSDEGKGHLNQFITELASINCGKSMVAGMPCCIYLIFFTPFSFHDIIQIIINTMENAPKPMFEFSLFVSYLTVHAR